MLHEYDSIGLLVARRLKKKLAGKADIKEVESDYISLLHEIAGYDVAIIVDAFLSASSELVILSARDLPATHPYLTHGIDLKSAIEIAEACSYEIPTEILLVGIPVSPDTFNSCAPIGEETLKLCDEATKLIAEMVEVLLDGG